jgi:DNA-binding NtrC family response regulator
MQSQAKTLTVLVVDDQSAIRDVLRRILDKAGGYAIAEAGSVSDALKTIGRTPPDAVVLDISMPGGPGFGLIKALQHMQADTKIMVLSSHHEMRSEVLAMGAHAFLPKTTPSKRVLATLEGILAT